MGWQVWIFAPEIIEGESLAKNSTPRTKPADSYIIHDSAGPNTSRSSTVATLKKRGGSTCWTIERDGSIHQHLPLDRYGWHANEWNKRAFAHDDMNAVNPENAVIRGGQKVIDAPWATWGEVVLSSPEQLESGWRLVRWLMAKHGVKSRFPAVQDGYYYWTFGGAKLPESWTDEGGVMAHAHVSGSRADGLTQALYYVLRHRGHGPDEAYALVQELSANAQKAEGHRFLYRSRLPATSLGDAAPLAALVGVAGYTLLKLWGVL